MIRWILCCVIGWIGAAIASRIFLGRDRLDPAAWSALDGTRWWDE